MNNPLENHSFIIKGRKIELPFTVTVKTKDGDFQVIATKLFKIAPKKRIVCSGKWGEQRIVMKFFLESRRANHYFKKELEGIKALIASGTRTPEIVFHGMVEHRNVRVIVLKEIFPASDMMFLWNNVKEDSDYADLQKLVIHEIAILHNAGLKQDDLHFGNFLMSENKVYTIDGDGVDTQRMGQPLSDKLSLENLSVLFGQFYPRIDKITKKSLEYYAELRGWASDSGLFNRLKPKIQKIRTIKLKKYLKKIFRECSEFVHKKNWNIELVCDRKAFDSGLEKFTMNPDLFIEKGKILGTEKTSIIARINIENTSYVVKRHNIKSLSPFSEKFLKKTCARISWHNAHLLKQRGDRLPRPILFMEERFGPFCLKAYFIIEANSINLEKNNYSALFQRLENNKLNPEQGEL